MMADDELIQTDQIQGNLSLNEGQKTILDALLDLMIPASEDGKMPGAREVGFPEYMVRNDAELVPELEQGLDMIIDATHADQGKSFFDLATSEQEILIGKFRNSQGEFLHLLTSLVMSCYYQDDRVITAIGLEARPPFPKGNEVDPGDFSLLEPVRQRGEIWRKL